VIGKLRLLAGAVVVCLAVAPAVVRATRVLDPSGVPSFALSFKKSFDEPPHAADAPPDLSVAPLAVVECPVAAPFCTPANTSAARAADTPRGPPVRIRF
jgi:hypothetical protein